MCFDGSPVFSSRYLMNTIERNSSVVKWHSAKRRLRQLTPHDGASSYTRGKQTSTLHGSAGEKLGLIEVPKYERVTHGKYMSYTKIDSLIRVIRDAERANPMVEDPIEWIAGSYTEVSVA